MKWRLLIAAVIFAVGAFLPLSPASTWTHGDEVTGAPAVSSGPDDLVSARRAAGEAASQVGFLTQGTDALSSGVVELDENSQLLIDALSSAQDGSQQLSDGMVKIQAGTGQLASGATEVADAIGGVVDQVVGFEAVRGQVMAAIDRALEHMANSREPDVVRSRDALTSLREQVRFAELPADVSAQMNQLKDGSREVANQLSVAGYAYHDGIYSATKGASDLASGLTELNSGAGAAGEGIDELRGGTEQIDHMAGLTQDKIEEIRRAIPAAVPVAGAADTQQEQPVSALAPLAAMLISALMIVGGFSLGAVAFTVVTGLRRRWSVLFGGAAFLVFVGSALAMILGTGISLAAQGAGLIALMSGVLASAGASRLLVTGLRPGVGMSIAAVLVAVQVALVGWVWKAASGGSVSEIVATASGVLPMHWLTAALSSAGNGGSAAALWAAVGLSAALAVVGLVPGFGRTSLGAK